MAFDVNALMHYHITISHGKFADAYDHNQVPLKTN